MRIWGRMSFYGVICGCRGKRDNRDHRDYRETNDYADIVARDLVVVSVVSVLSIRLLSSSSLLRLGIVCKQPLPSP